MKIKFKAVANMNDDLYIDKAIFTLKNGTTIGVDRYITAYTPGFLAGEEFDITFENFYLYSLNGFAIFTTEDSDGFHLYDTYEKMEFNKLLRNATCEFEYDEEAPEGYECRIKSWEIV